MIRIPDYNLFSRYVVLACLLILIAGCTEQPPPPAHDIRAEAYFQNPTLLKQAWRLPVARTYEDAFEYQINWAFCGPASLVSVFGSIDPNSVATQSGLFDQSDIWYLKARIFGLTLDELAQLARDNGEYTVEIIRDIDLDSFRQLLQQMGIPLIPTTHSGVNRPPVPEGSVHSFRGKSSSRSGVNRPPWRLANQDVNHCPTAPLLGGDFRGSDTVFF